MKIQNETKGTIVSNSAKEALSFLDRSFGLLLRENPKTLIFYTRFGLHTFGLRSSIDILVLDRNHKVVRLEKGLKPNRFFLYSPIYRTVIELPDGAIDLSKTHPGDKLKFV